MKTLKSRQFFVSDLMKILPAVLEFEGLREPDGRSEGLRKR
jgi:hypothetical protein